MALVEDRLSVRELPAEERPREKLRLRGATQLSHQELLAILLRTGRKGEDGLSLAQHILMKWKGLRGLAQADLSELEQEPGVGPAKASVLKAALELGARMGRLRSDDRALVRTPQDIANLLQAEMAFLEQEELRVVLLDTRNHVDGIEVVSRGTLNTAQVRPADLFRLAVRRNCASIIVAHNHPSGDPAPSPDDVRLTAEIVAAGRMLGVEVLDHLVIGRERWVSLKREGLGFMDK